MDLSWNFSQRKATLARLTQVTADTNDNNASGEGPASAWIDAGIFSTKVWRNQDILEQFGEVRNILDPASIKAAPECFFFKPGEAFVLPSERYHVGLNSTLSTTAAIVVDVVSDGKAAAREAQSLGSFFDAMPEPKKSDLRLVTFEDLSRLNGLRSSSNHFLRFARAKRSFDVAGLSERTMLKIETSRIRGSSAPTNLDYLFSRLSPCLRMGPGPLDL